MNIVKIKPLSINKAYTGRRFKTAEYKVYERDLLYILPPTTALDFVRNGEVQLTIKVGLSTHNADLSNTIKCFEDILQKKYDFNDKNVIRIVMDKEYVKKGDEFIAFDIINIE